MLATGAELPLALRVEPALAEAAVFRVEWHHGRSAPPELAADRRPSYELGDPIEREAAFGRNALAEFDALGLGQPVFEALAERPELAAQVRVVLLAEAGGRRDEGVTCEPGGKHLGIRIDAARFDDPAALLGWMRHALGHAEDTLDPGFGFEPGWEEGGSGPVAAAIQSRLHGLWDVSVDARLAAEGHLEPAATRARHSALIARSLPGVADAGIDAVTDLIWLGPRPSFGELMAWAARPRELLRLVAPEAADQPRPDRCPLCDFPSDDVLPPAATVAALVLADYPSWRPADGLCGRCTDRYRLAGRLGGPP